MSVHAYIADKSNRIANKVRHSYNDAEMNSHLVRMTNNIVGIRGTRADDTFLSGIQSVTLGTNVLSVANYAFQGCTNLKTFQPNDKLKYIGVSAFCGCTSLSTIEFLSTIKNIRAAAFMGCSSLQNVDFPSNVANYGASSFMGCSSLKSVSVDVSASSNSWTFADCTSLKTAQVKRTLTNSMFRDDTSLQSVTCYSLADVPSNCFRGCSSLTSIEFQKPIASFGGASFYGCTSLCELQLSSSHVKTLPNKFLHGTKISSLVLPKTLDNISNLTAEACSACFDGMSMLSSVTFNGMDDKYISTNKKIFNRFGCNHNFTVYSKDGTRYELKSSGKGLRLSDPDEGTDVANIYVVTVAHTGGNQGEASNSLPGMYNDTQRLCNMIEQATSGTSLSVVYKKFNNGGDWQHSVPSSVNVKAAIDAAKVANPDLFIFHFSDHGNSSSPTGYMTFPDGDSLSYQYIYNELSGFTRSFVIMCCCYPWQGVNESTLSKKPKALVWNAGQTNVVTWMDPGIGHRLMTAMTQCFNKSYTYSQLWKAMESNSSFRYDNKYGAIVQPQQIVYGNFNTNNKVFM